jgi:hypothetical protein
MTDPIVIRHSSEADGERLRELAELDGRHAPQGDALLAEVDGRLLAAVGIEDGVTVADPFEPTGAIVDLLRLRAEQEHVLTNGAGPLLGRLMLIRQRAGAIA